MMRLLPSERSQVQALANGMCVESHKHAVWRNCYINPVPLSFHHYDLYLQFVCLWITLVCYFGANLVCGMTFAGIEWSCCIMISLAQQAFGCLSCD